MLVCFLSKGRLVERYSAIRQHAISKTIRSSNLGFVLEMAEISITYWAKFLFYLVFVTRHFYPSLVLTKKKPLEWSCVKGPITAAMLYFKKGGNYSYSCWCSSINSGIF